MTRDRSLQAEQKERLVPPIYTVQQRRHQSSNLIHPRTLFILAHQHQIRQCNPFPQGLGTSFPTTLAC